MRLSESEKKVLLMWSIVASIIVVVLSLIAIKKIVDINEENNNIKKSLIYGNSRVLNDVSLYYTVKSFVTKMYSYINTQDKDNLSIIIDEEYLKSNDIDNLLNNYTNKVSYNSYDKICVKNYKGSNFEFVTKGYETEKDTINKIRDVYYVVKLDYNNMIFSIIPSNDVEYEEVCNEKIK